MKKLRVLLVDDEEEFVTTLAERLELRDIETVIAMEGDAALRIIGAEDPPPVVVLDVMMPGIGGFDVLQEVMRRHPQTQVILLTGRGSTNDGIKGMRLGAYDYMMKPVKLEALIQRINEAFRASMQEKAEDEAVGP
jgi:DNA-binding response OmpR family regulator